MSHIMSHIIPLVYNLIKWSPRPHLITIHYKVDYKVQHLRIIHGAYDQCIYSFNFDNKYYIYIK